MKFDFEPMADMLTNANTPKQIAIELDAICHDYATMHIQYNPQSASEMKIVTRLETLRLLRNVLLKMDGTCVTFDN